MGTFSAEWISVVVVGLGTLFLVGELFVNMKGFFGILGIGFITLYFLSYLDPGMFILMIIIYLLGIVLIIIDGKLLNDGTLATLGVVCMILSVGLSSPNWVSGLYAVIGVITGGICSLFFLKVFKRRNMWTKMTLVDQLTKEQGYTTLNTSYANLVGKEGVTQTDMRPVGTIRVKGKDYSAITNGQWLTRGTPIKVVHVDGTKIQISKIETDSK